MIPRRNVLAHISKVISIGVPTLVLAASSVLAASTFRSQETYLADGQALTVTQKLGQAVIQFDPAATQNTAPTTFIAPDNTQYVLEVDLRGARGLYTMQMSGPVTESSNAAAIDSLNTNTGVKYAYPVFAAPGSGMRRFLNDEIVVRTKAPLTPDDFASFRHLGLRVVKTLSASENIHVLRLLDPKNYNPFSVCSALLTNASVLWDDPNMEQEGTVLLPPTDSKFDDQWHLHNTGELGGKPDADVDFLEVWEAGKGEGSPGIRIAILDTGVIWRDIVWPGNVLETTHPDLQPNIVPGYDFKDMDADPNPSTSGEGAENHGTAVAGIVAAVVNNNLGVAGIAGKCKILPVRVIQTDNWIHTFATPSQIYQALVYAADNADVINCSWAISPSSTITAGFSYAYSNGRGGKGCAVFCAAGNSAAGEGDLSYNKPLNVNIFDDPPDGLGLGAGTYRVEFSYEKDANQSAGDDAVWLADIRVPLQGQSGYTLFTFDNGTFDLTGWTPGSSGQALFVLNGNDLPHTHGTSRYALRSGTIGHGQRSTLESPDLSITSANRWVYFRRWMSSHPTDVLKVHVKPQDGRNPITIPFGGGEVPLSSINTAVLYPANLSTTLAVGASTDFDYRSHFSHHDSTLTFVAGSGGGAQYIITTDRMGDFGYSAYDSSAGGDYAYSFEGTSAASPLAAGIAALVLSRNGNQNASVVSDRLITTCVDIGRPSEPYTGTFPYTRNDYYGYGRVNANAAVNAVTPDSTGPSFVSATVLNWRAVDVVFSEPMGDGVLTPGNYSIIAGRGTLSLNPNKVIRIGLVPAGFGVANSVYRLIWNLGDIATSGTVTIQATSSIKDVAGNALTSTSRSSTGTKRLVAVNCGSADEFLYTPPYLSDNGFQGNEVAEFLMTDSDFITTTASIDTSGVTGPAPVAVYQSQRKSWNPDPDVPVTYALPNLPAENLTVRLHFAEIYYDPDNPFYGQQVFDIYINGTLKTASFDIFLAAGQQDKAVVMEYPNIAPQGGVITVMLSPQQSPYWGDYRCGINGIEVVKP